MVLRFVVKPVINKISEGVSGLANSQQLRAGRSWVVETSSSATTAIRFALGAVTAFTAGFLFSLGLDAMVLIGKWEILLAMIFYAGVLWALVSPFTLLPRMVAGAANTLHSFNQAQAQAESEEKRKKIEELERTHAEDLKAYEESQSIRPNWMRSKKAIENERMAEEKLKATEQKLEQLGARAPVKEPAKKSSVAVSSLRAVAFLLYGAVFFVAVWLMLGPTYGIVTVVSAAALFLLAQWLGFTAILPYATVLMIFLGYGIGERFQRLPLSAYIETDSGLQRARIVASTSTELIVLTSASDGNRRPVALIPRNVVRKITIDPNDGLFSALPSLQTLLRQ